MKTGPKMHKYHLHIPGYLDIIFIFLFGIRRTVCLLHAAKVFHARDAREILIILDVKIKH